MKKETYSSIISVFNIYVIGTLAGYGSLTYFSGVNWLAYTQSTLIALGVTVAATASITLYTDRTHKYRFEDEKSDSDSNSNID